MNCEECGSPLIRVLGEETITTLEGRTIVFRRQSDYLLCQKCLRLYSIVNLRGGEDDESGKLEEFASLVSETDMATELPFPKRRASAAESD